MNSLGLSEAKLSLLLHKIEKYIELIMNTFITLGNPVNSSLISYKYCHTI